MESTQSWIIPCLRIMEGLFEVCGRCLSLDPPSLPRRANREFSPVTYFLFYSYECHIAAGEILNPHCHPMFSYIHITRVTAPRPPMHRPPMIISVSVFQG